MISYFKGVFHFNVALRLAVALLIALDLYGTAVFAETFVVDDGDSGTSSTGEWRTSSGSYPYGDGSLWSRTTDGTYSSEAGVSGFYEVSLWWTEWSSRCTNVPVKIYDGATLIDTVYVNQQDNVGQWNLLGSYNFQNGSGRVTVISVDGSCSTCADAVKFVYLPLETVVDNCDINFETIGDWSVSTYFPGYFGINYLWASSGDPLKEASWTFNVLEGGIYQILASWTVGPNRSGNVPYVLYNNYIDVGSVIVDQRTRYRQFTPLWTEEVESGVLGVTLISSESGSVVADAIKMVRCCETLPCVRSVRPWDHFFQTDQDLTVSAKVFDANGSQEDWGVKFVLNGGISQGGQEVFDYTLPHEVTFSDLSFSEHSIESILVDEFGNPSGGSSGHHELNNIGIGKYYVAIGDSITFGFGDDLGSDDSSEDGRNVGGGYTPILNDLLSGEKGYPVLIINEGVGGAVSAGGVSSIGDILDRRPDAERYLIQYGTNDANPLLPVPSGLGLNPDDDAYPGTLKDNMQQIIDAINVANKEPCLAKPGMDVDSDTRNALIQEYNLVIDELRSIPENNISVEPPDFYSFFESHHEEEYYDSIHPNGKGYRSMADLWYNALTQ